METTTVATPSGREEPSGRGEKKFRIEALRPLRGRVRLEVDGEPVGILDVANGQIELVRDDGGAADATVATSKANEEHVRRMLRGERNPIVELLLGRYSLRGNAGLAAAILLGLQGVKSAAADEKKEA